MKHPLVFCFLFLFTTASASSVIIDRIVAVVNGDIITLSEVQKINAVYSSQNIRRDALNDLIEKRLILQEAKKLGIKTTDDELKDAIEDIKRKNNIDDTGFMSLLAKEGVTLEEYKANLKDQLTIGRIVETEVRSKIVVTDKDISDYYREHLKDFTLPEESRVRHIFLRIDKNNPIAVRGVVRDIMKKLKEGVAFADLAKVYSSDEASAKAGGDIGFLKKGQMSPELESIVFSLKSGEVSEPVFTENGVHIIKVEETKGNRQQSLSEVSNKIKEILLQKTYEKRYNEWIRGLRKKAFIEQRWD
ncbi:MAG: peptidylprolyl isomerase [Nitrospirota bacterium]